MTCTYSVYHKSSVENCSCGWTLSLLYIYLKISAFLLTYTVDTFGIGTYMQQIIEFNSFKNRIIRENTSLFTSFIQSEKVERWNDISWWNRRTKLLHCICYPNTSVSQNRWAKYKQEYYNKMERKFITKIPWVARTELLWKLIHRLRCWKLTTFEDSKMAAFTWPKMASCTITGTNGAREIMMKMNENSQNMKEHILCCCSAEHSFIQQMIFVVATSVNSRTTWRCEGWKPGKMAAITS